MNLQQKKIKTYIDCELQNDHMRKNSTLLLRLSENQKKLITSEAKKLNISTSELIRRILINGIQ